MARKLAAGNWKMNGTAGNLAEIDAIAKAHPSPSCDVLICPPATLLSRLSDRTSGTAIQSGGQDCHAATSGAHTGDTSAQMIADAGGSHVIVGHSERRADHGETDADIAAKAQAVWAAGLVAVICVGETLAEREAGQTINIVAGQLAGSIPDGASSENTVIAYEPVWAIGTGKVPTLDEIAAVHSDVRARLMTRFGASGDDMPILYGGSVKPSNADNIFGVPHVNGALVGGASLKAEDFGGIISALERA